MFHFSHNDLLVLQIPVHNLVDKKQPSTHSCVHTFGGFKLRTSPQVVGHDVPHELYTSLGLEHSFD